MWTTLLLGVAFAGKPAASLAAGEQMLLAGDAESAIEHLDKAIGAAKGTELARGHALRARARVLLVPDDPKQAEPAVADVLAARAADPKGELSQLVEDTAAEVRGALTQAGSERFAKDDWAGARPLLEQALRLDDAQLPPHELLCLMSEPLAVPALADAHCDRAMTLADRADEVPDPGRALAAAILAHRHLAASPPDPAAASAALDRGLALLDALHARREGARDLYDDASWAAFDRVEAKVRGTLEDLRLNTRLVDPGARAGAIDELTAAVKKTPGDAGLRLALADALTRAGRDDEAIPAWKDAIAADPARAEGHFGLAALYMNQAAALAERYNETDDPAAAEKLLAQVMDRFRLARPLLDAARAANPKEPAITGALKQVCTQLKDQACLAGLP